MEVKLLGGSLLRFRSAFGFIWDRLCSPFLRLSSCDFERPFRTAKVALRSLSKPFEGTTFVVRFFGVEVVSELFWKPKQAEEWGRRPATATSNVLVTFAVNFGLLEMYVAFMSLLVLSLGSLGSPGGGFSVQLLVFFPRVWRCGFCLSFCLRFGVDFGGIWHACWCVLGVREHAACVFGTKGAKCEKRTTSLWFVTDFVVGAGANLEKKNRSDQPGREKWR